MTMGFPSANGCYCCCTANATQFLVRQLWRQQRYHQCKKICYLAQGEFSAKHLLLGKHKDAAKILSAKGQGNPLSPLLFWVLFIELLHTLKLKKKWGKGIFMIILNSEIIKELDEIQNILSWLSGIIIYSVNLRVVIATYSWCAVSSSQAALNPKLPTTCTTTAPITRTHCCLIWDIDVATLLKMCVCAQFY